MAFSPDQVQALRNIHRRVMARFIYKTDLEQFGIPEHWEGDDTLFAKVRDKVTIKGDCEEASRAFMILAIEAGLQARLVVGWDEDGAGHCWCEVTDPMREQAVYLDNRREKLVGFDSIVTYIPHSASPWNPIPGETRDWVELKRP